MSEAPKIVGRSETVAELRALLDAVVTGRGGGALLEGEAGIGKSTVLSVVAGAAAEAGCQVLTATADELDREFPLHVIDVALRSKGLARPRPTAGDGSGLWSPSSGDPVLAGVEAALEQLDGLSRFGPTVLLVDDLQWADDASLLVLDRLSQASVQQPVLVIGAYRTTAGRERLAGLRRSMIRRSARILALGPLAAGDAVTLAAIHAGGRPGRGLRQWVESTAGNPLFIREVVDALDRHGYLRSADGVVEVVPDSPSAPVVLSLLDVIAERLVTLTEQTQDALRLAAVIGPEFGSAELGEISGMTPTSLLAALREAIGSGVVEEVGERLRFRHGLIRESLYESVPASLRSSAHLDAARAVARTGAQASAVAVHLLHMEGDLPPWASEWLVNDGASLVYDVPGVAIRLIRAAQIGAEPDPARWENLNVGLARARFQLGSLADAAAAAERVLERTTDPDHAAEMAWIKAYAALRATDYDVAVETIKTGRSKWRLGEVWVIRLRTLHALVLANSGDIDGGAELATQTLKAARAVADPFAVGHALFVLSWTESVRGNAGQMIDYIDAALEALSAERSATDLKILLLANRGMGLFAVGRGSEAMESYEIARGLAERSGSARLSMISMSVGCAHFESGDWDEALRDLATALETKEAPWFQFATCHGVSATIHAHRGDAKAAQGQLSALDEIGEPAAPVPSYRAWVWLARAALAEQRGDLAEAVAHLELALDCGPVYWYMSMPGILRLGPQERPDLVAKVLDLVAVPLDADTEPLIRAGAEQARATAAGDAEAVLAAAERFGGLPWSRAVSLETAAELFAADDVERARGLLVEAMGLYEALGARVDMDRAEARLRACGIRLGVRGARRRPKTGLAALTTAEERVAKLVAEGLTNPDIADRLFLSRRTVQSHVSRVLAKLDVPSRSGIALIIAEQAHGAGTAGGLGEAAG
ncbi:ATP-binding protein [Catenulispora rubra]|uniref:ATP-binding protein n=1 Tax=Catenulispora rubra TaxID=280293 RepID=UPI0018927144|nr:LuxR family transcriptional regulator [Catenulispora rubra]